MHAAPLNQTNGVDAPTLYDRVRKKPMIIMLSLHPYKNKLLQKEDDRVSFNLFISVYSFRLLHLEVNRSVKNSTFNNPIYCHERQCDVENSHLFIKQPLSAKSISISRIRISELLNDWVNFVDFSENGF